MVLPNVAFPALCHARLAATCMLLLAGGTATAAERPRVFAIRNATVVTAPGNSLENGVVVIRDGLIESVGAGTLSPADAVEIDAAGGVVYAGLIDPWTRLGLSSGETAEPGGRGPAGSPAPETGAVHPLARIRPEHRAVDGLRAFDDDSRKELENRRRLGYTAVASVPGSGLLRGTAAVILLSENRPVAEIVLQTDAVAHAAFERGGFGEGYPTSLMGAAAALRQAFLDGRRYAEWSERYAADPAGLRRPDRHAAFEALLPVLRGRQRLFWRAESPHDLLLADAIGTEFGLDLVLAGDGSEWELANELAARGHPLVVSLGFPEKPDVKEDDAALGVSRRELRRWVEAPAGPERLRAAGARFAFTTHGLETLSDTFDNLRSMIEAGLPEETALAALTTVPAELLGVERILGTLEPGKIANLCVATGPLFAEATQIREVFVDGRRHEIEIKKKPESDPDAVVDPRGTWIVSIDFGGRVVERTWTVEGDAGDYSGTAETGSGTVDFEKVTLEGNLLTVRLPGRGGRGSVEIPVIVTGDKFEGETEMGSRTATVRGKREAGPQRGDR